MMTAFWRAKICFLLFLVLRMVSNVGVPRAARNLLDRINAHVEETSEHPASTGGKCLQ